MYRVPFTVCLTRASAALHRRVLPWRASSPDGPRQRARIPARLLLRAARRPRGRALRIAIGASAPAGSQAGLKRRPFAPTV